MNSNNTVNDFLNYLKFEKHFSEHTAKCYGADLSQFTEFLLGKADGDYSDHGSGGLGTTAVAAQPSTKVDHLLLAVDVNSVRAYLAELNDRQYSKSTVARKLATLRSFYKFLLKRGSVGSKRAFCLCKRQPKVTAGATI